jgi:hypothetical protein
MAAEAIPLINALLDAMGLTAAGSAKGKKYDVPEKDVKKLKSAATTAIGLAGKNPLKVASGIAGMMHDDPYEGLSEEEKQKLANEANSAVEGFGGDPDNKNNKNDDKAKAAGAAATATGANTAKKNSGWHLDPDAQAKGDRLAAAKDARKNWGREIVVDESSIMGGSKAAKKQGMSDPEAVQISREKFMEGKANSLDTDKAISELHGQQKAKLRNRTVTQDASDILEHHKAPEDTRMTNKALPDDKLKKALGLGVGGIIGGIANALPLAGADAYELDEDELTDFLKSVQKYINSDDENDKAIGRAMMDSYLEDLGITIDDLINKEAGDNNTELTWEQIKPEAERLINSDDPEDRKKGHELIERYYLDDKKEPKKSKGKGLKGTDLY